jgi:Ca2+-binding RTX toxin-like protein
MLCIGCFVSTKFQGHEKTNNPTINSEGELAMSIPVGGTWKQTFGDEFNGTSVNTSVWGTNWLGVPGTITKPVASSEIGAYDPAQVSESGGVLHLKAIASPVTVNGVNYNYRSGLVNTYDTFRQTYGYFEARINLEGSGGKISDWPAFWLAGNNWPTDGELDVMEGLGGDAAYHFHSPAGGPGKTVPGDYTGWHVFGALWEPGKVSYYYDNVLVGTITSGITSAPQYLIMNLGVAQDAQLKVPAEMQVDWVHAYSLDPNGPVVTPPPVVTPSPVTTPPPNAIVGTSGNDSIAGNSANNTMLGLAGFDRLWGNGGNDNLDGGSGNDHLDGGTGTDRLFGAAGADRLAGGLGADTFVFNSITDSRPGSTNNDSIINFRHSEGDRISLSTIDANTAVTGDQAFHFIGMAHFTHQGAELQYVQIGSGILVSADVNGDGVSDFSIAMNNITNLVAADFIL